jgi:hypothetical protein
MSFLVSYSLNPSAPTRVEPALRLAVVALFTAHSPEYLKDDSEKPREFHIAFHSLPTTDLFVNMHRSHIFYLILVINCLVSCSWFSSF